MTFRDVLSFLVGVALTVFAVGWWGEYRVRMAERAAVERWDARVAEYVLFSEEALRLALANPVERGLAKSQAVTNVLRQGKRDPSVKDGERVGR